MSIIGLDLGEKKIGVAIAEPPTYVSVPLRTLLGLTDDEVVNVLKRVANERRAKKLVVGLPLDARGALSEKARSIRLRAVKLARAIGLPIFFVNERFSSKEAQSYLRQSCLPSRKRKIYEDSLSACLILDTYIREAGIKSGDN